MYFSTFHIVGEKLLCPSLYSYFLEILEVDVYPNSTTILLDKLKLKIYFDNNYYSSMDQHVLTG